MNVLPETADDERLKKNSVLVYFSLTLISLIIVVCGGFTVYTLQMAADVERFVESSNLQLSAEASAITNELKVPLYTGLFLAREAEVHNVLSEPEEMQLLGQDFFTQMMSIGLFDQIRILDAKGMEHVRVDGNGDKTDMATESQLQSKADRYYYRESMKLADGDIFMSRLDLNVERGKVELPLKPTIRFSIPLFNSSGSRPDGMLVMNYLASPLLDRFQKLVAEQEGLGLQLINSEGYFLSSHKPEDEWGFMLEERKSRNVAMLYPEIWQAINDNDHGMIEHQGNYYVFVSIDPLAAIKELVSGAAYSDQKLRWTLLRTLPSQVYQQIQRGTMRTVLIWGVPLLLLLWLVAYFAVRAYVHRQELAGQIIKHAELTSRLEAVGTLAGGMAHEFNNMLASMMGNLHLIKNEPKNYEKNIERIHRIEKSGFRGAKVLSQMLSFARRDIPTLRAVAVKPFIGDLYDMARVSIHENIQMKQDILIDDSCAIQADVKQLQSALLSLLNNAAQALEGVSEPQISIHIHRFEIDELFRQQYPDIHSSEVVAIGVEDNGCGIPAVNMERIMEPFFSTRSVGMGSGMGLSMVYGMVKMHGGEISVESKPGGTLFTLYLPVGNVENDATGIAKELVEHIKPASHVGLILLADDNLSLLEADRELLELFGYKVLLARNGNEALHLFEQHQASLSMVILDQVMPGKSGLEVAQAMRCVRSSMPIIIQTGYDPEEMNDKMQSDANYRVLRKPVMPEELEWIIASMLDQQ